MKKTTFIVQVRYLTTTSHIARTQVLSVDAERKRLSLTHKKTLVNSEFPVITNFAEAEVGMKTHGFIKSIQDYGCFVHFYNNIHGLVPKAQLG